ncbi:MAG: YcaQ family DNA glycosylase [Tetrasphaera sp.]|nr:YcaQ family DNA glycosylase [Tetrasphaera sp.]
MPLSRAAAVRIALAAQGFSRPRPAPGAVRGTDLVRVMRTVKVVQIDSVNVLTRSQYLPFFSRLGPYDVRLLDRLRDRAPRRAVEYWAHEASLIDPALWPLLGFRMARAHDDSWGGMQRVARDHPELVHAVRAQVAALGPLTARELERAMAHDGPRERADWGWNWSLVKNALEHLFWAGEISSAGRTSQFERRYAPTARVLPPPVRAAADPAHRPPAATAYAELVEISARALGVGTEQCLRDYVRLRPEQARPAIEALVASGVLIPARIQGWARPAYLHRDARRPRRVAGRALLSPFDSLIWQRDRVRALWGFDYRLEIYVPAPQRRHGYYVLPFLLDEELVARVDLKADRAAGVLRVNHLTWEDGRGGAQDRAALEGELDLLAGWLLTPAEPATP